MAQDDGQFTRAATWAILAIAVGAGVGPALQPLLLGALLKAGRLDAAALGHAAMIESLGMAVASTIATFALRPNRLRWLTGGALLATFVAAAGTMMGQGVGILWARGLNGVANGVLLWLLVGMITRSRAPAQVFAYYITGQSIAAFALSALFARIILPASGANAAYLVLLAVNIALLLVAMPFVPRAFSAHAGGGVDAGQPGDDDGPAASTALPMPPPLGWLALLGVGAQIAAVMAFWVYAVPLAMQAGITQGAANDIISLANAGLIVAGLAACATAARFRPVPVIIITALVSIGALAVTGNSANATMWTAALFLFAFAWTYAPPFHMTYLLQADQSGRAAMLVSPAQLLGMAAGPMLAATAVRDGDFTGARTIA
ncbi:MAG: hypothetical protein ACKOUM_12590, partial [Sphingopyxis sp.]